MSSLQRRAPGYEPVWALPERIAYRSECARIWLVDVLPVLLKYRAIQLGRDVREEWRGLVAETGERMDAWLDRHGF